MTEEQVTKKILSWLVKNGWEIVCFDFPQSGTGKYLHPNDDIRINNTKNNAAFIPDIVAVKNQIAIFFENKNRFYLDDFTKLNNIKYTNIYTDSINKLLMKYEISKYYFGIGALYNKNFLNKCIDYTNLVDFIILINTEELIVYKDCCFNL